MSSNPYVFTANTLTLDDPMILRRGIHCNFTFGILQANGGIIIQCSTDKHTGETPEYFIIPDGVEDFDRELGKIISMYLIKVKQ